MKLFGEVHNRRCGKIHFTPLNLAHAAALDAASLRQLFFRKTSPLAEVLDSLS